MKMLNKLILPVAVLIFFINADAFASQTATANTLDQLTCNDLADAFYFALPEKTSIDQNLLSQATNLAALGKEDCELNPEQGMVNLQAALNDIGVPVFN